MLGRFPALILNYLVTAVGAESVRGVVLAALVGYTLAREPRTLPSV